MTSSINLPAYCARIGYRGPLEPSLETLNGLVRHHVQSIPFENLDVLLGQRISLDLRAIEDKLIQRRRGGYCFEQNTLLLHVLESLGFSVTPISARVRVQRPRDMTPSRTHLFLRVEIDGLSYLADVGVGGLSSTAALRLTVDVEQATPHEPRRILRDGAWAELELRGPQARLFHQAHFAGAWHDVCEFTLEPMPPIDREVANWFTSTHPQSHFRDRLLVARATPSGRVSLLNRELTRRQQNGESQTRRLGSRAELLDVLAEHFGIELPRDTRFTIPELMDLA